LNHRLANSVAILARHTLANLAAYNPASTQKLHPRQQFSAANIDTTVLLADLLGRKRHDVDKARVGQDLLPTDQH
jgi:hypothetical protein